MKKFFRDGLRYGKWWALVGAFGGLATPVLNTPADQFWYAKTIQIINGLLFGAMCWAVQVPAQNLLNAERKRWKSWAIGLTVWMGMKFLIAYLMGEFDNLSNS